MKKTPLSEYSRPRSIGIIAINLREDDELVDVARTDGSRDIMLFSDAGKAVRFNENSVRGMNLDDGQRVIALCVVEEQGDILTITENGYGKRTPVADYPQKGRGTKGVISIACSARNGQAVCAVQVLEDEHIMLVTDNGTLVRTRVAEISTSGRNTQGVRLIRTTDHEKLIAVAKIVAESEDSEGDEGMTEESGEE